MNASVASATQKCTNSRIWKAYLITCWLCNHVPCNAPGGTKILTKYPTNTTTHPHLCKIHVDFCSSQNFRVIRAIRVLYQHNLRYINPPPKPGEPEGVSLFFFVFVVSFVFVFFLVSKVFPFVFRLNVDTLLYYACYLNCVTLQPLTYKTGT